MELIGDPSVQARFFRSIIKCLEAVAFTWAEMGVLTLVKLVGSK
jgi:hypothetical protein